MFNKLIFPTIDPLAGTMAAFATYAAVFFARPLGGVVFGHFGDKLGRKSMLVTTLMLRVNRFPSSGEARRGADGWARETLEMDNGGSLSQRERRFVGNCTV